MSNTSTVRLPVGSSLKTVPTLQRYDLTNPADERQETLRELLVTHHGAAAPLKEPRMLLHDHMPHVCNKPNTMKSTVIPQFEN